MPEKILVADDDLDSLKLIGLMLQRKGYEVIAANTGAALMLSGENPIVADFRLGAGSMGLSIGFGRSQGMANVLTKPAAEIRPKMIEGELAVHQSGLRTLLSSVRSKEAMTNFPLE